MKHERTCSICGQVYEYCPNCPTFDDKPRWMFLFHDENCKHIWEVLNAYQTNVKNATQAKNALQRLNLSRKDKFVEPVKKLISKIYSEAEPDKRHETKLENKSNK